jgi:hypothetical protein
MKYLQRLNLIRRRFPTLLLVPFLSRGINLLFTPFVIGVFGNEGFIKVSILLLMSFLLSVTIELGVKQKILIYYQTKEFLIIYFLKWLITISAFLTTCILFYTFFDSRTGLIDSRDLIVVGLDAVLNVSLNSFYLGYLQARGKSDSILRINLLCLLLVSIPRVYLLLTGITEPWLWVLFGSIFRLLVLGRVIIQFRSINSWKQLQLSNIIRLFDKGSLNSIFGLIVVLTLTLDKFVGTHLYESSSVVAYLLAFQFVSMSGSLYEQILVRYFPRVRDSLSEDNAREHIRIIFFGLLFLGSILNGVYSAIGLVVFPDLNPVFFPTLFLLSFQPLAWGLLIIWQNVIGPSASNFDHVRYMGVSLIFESLVLSALFIFRNLGVMFLAGATATSFLVCLIGLSNSSKRLGLVFVPSGELVVTFSLFLFATGCLYFSQSSVYGVMAVFILIISLLVSRAISIRFASKIREMFGASL